MNLVLSTNFALDEMTRSDLATRLGKPVVAPPEVVMELTRLCNDVLQPVRYDLGLAFGPHHPIIVSSGYRPLWLNTMVKGSKKSAHLYGRAADFRVLGLLNHAVAEFIAARIDKYPIDQLIYEFGDWVHVAVSPVGTAPRHEILTAVRSAKGKVEYITGIVQQEEN